MKVLVLGASGRLGRVLTRTLAADCTVTAFTRHPGPLLTGDPSIRIFGGSVLDARAVDRAMHGQEAVIWAVANRPTADRSAIPLLYGARVVIRAMTHAGTARLIYASDLGAHDEKAQGPGALLRSVLGGGARRDARERETAVRESPLDWTIVRPTRPSQVSRNDAAAFIASQLREPTSVRHIIPAPSAPTTASSSRSAR
jgi:nucleoside-diphosphate-sugar epimerase